MGERCKSYFIEDAGLIPVVHTGPSDWLSMHWAHHEGPPEQPSALRGGAGEQLHAELALVAAEDLEDGVALQQRVAAGALPLAQCTVH